MLTLHVTCPNAVTEATSYVVVNLVASTPGASIVSRYGN